MKFPFKDFFFSKCDQCHSYLKICSYYEQNPFRENLFLGKIQTFSFKLIYHCAYGLV